MSGIALARSVVPLTWRVRSPPELVRYAIDLRSPTFGTAVFTRRRLRYDPMPEDVPRTWRPRLRR
ncbi:hypothetical protein [Amycolatopsis antarctica]|uniref:hypothetical protein n=1 Tax=Amycolatopsis antarctica TaxID=1854586 RepID=UPI001055AA66|nr:hypothetical protein [Amycolatopsis antarctica]